MSWMTMCMRRIGCGASGAFYRRLSAPAPGPAWPVRGGSGPALLLALGLPALGTGCAALGSINLFTYQDDVELGAKAYDEILAEEKLIRSGPELEMVQEVTDRLVEAVRVEHPEVAEMFDWEVSLIDAPETVNAFCLPGGKMAVYTGILPVCEGDAGLAVVMGHEIAHATERHGTEAMTRQVGVQVLLDYIAGSTETQVAGIAAGLMQLRFGRGAELEADHEGLTYMARAGYDPREAIGFWKRMGQLGGGQPIEWLSTHPSHGTRIEELEARMPHALEVWREATGQAP